MAWRKRWWLVICFIFNIAFLPPVLQGAERSLRLLITSDLHGWGSTTLLFPGRRPKGLFHLAGLIHRRRTEKTLLLDAGDLISGSPYLFYHHTVSPLFPNFFYQLFQQLGYDAVVVGNHDLERISFLRQPKRPEATFPWLSANVLWEGRPLFSPYRIFTKNNLKIAVLGLTTAYSQLWMSRTEHPQLTFISSVLAARQWLKVIQQKERPDVVIGLFHLSLGAFRDNWAGKLSRIAAEENIETVLQYTKMLDLVITGHDHRLHPYRNRRALRYVRGIPVIQGGHWGQALLELNLRVIGTGNVAKLKHLDYRVHYPKRDEKLAKKYQEDVGEAYRRYLFEKMPLTIAEHRRDEAELCLNQLQAIANDQPQLDATWLPKVKLKTRIPLKGIQRRHFFQWFPYHNQGKIMYLSLRDLERLQEERGDRRKTARTLFFQAKNSIVSLSNPENHDRFRRQYRVLISDYHYYGGAGWIQQIFPERREEKKTMGGLREQTIKYIQQRKTLPKSCYFLSYSR